MLLIGNLGETASLDAKKMKEAIDHYDSSLLTLGDWAQPNWVIGNHDVRRVRSRYKGDEYISRCLHTLLLTLRGTPTIYNGDEFGMLDGEVTKAQAEDPTCKVDVNLRHTATARPLYGHYMATMYDNYSATT